MTTITRDPQVGDYMVASWGYEQTNASFYMVVGRTPKMVDVVAVESKKFQDTNLLAPTDRRKMSYDRETGGYTAPPKRLRRKIQEGGWISVENYMVARVYDGTGAYDTIAAGEPGH